MAQTAAGPDQLSVHSWHGTRVSPLIRAARPGKGSDPSPPCQLVAMSLECMSEKAASRAGKSTKPAAGRHRVVNVRHRSASPLCRQCHPNARSRALRPARVANDAALLERIIADAGEAERGTIDPERMLRHVVNDERTPAPPGDHWSVQCRESGGSERNCEKRCYADGQRGDSPIGGIRARDGCNYRDWSLTRATAAAPPSYDQRNT